MSTDIKQITDRAGTVAEVAVGAAKTAREVASDPMGVARKQVRDLERKGTPTVRKANRRFTARLHAATAPAKDAVKSINERFDVVSKKASKRAEKVSKEAEKVAYDLLPERIALRGLHIVKVQARRHDMVGLVAKRTLRMFNVSFKMIAKSATRLEHASELAPRPVVQPKAAVRSRRPRRTIARRRAA